MKKIIKAIKKLWNKLKDIVKSLKRVVDEDLVMEVTVTPNMTEDECVAVVEAALADLFGPVAMAMIMDEMNKNDS